MEKYKNRIIFAALTMLVLVFAFVFGGSKPKESDLPVAATESVSPNISETQTLPPQSTGQSVLAPAPESTPKAEEKPEVVQTESPTQAPAKAEKIKPEITAEPTETAVANKCTLSVRCDTILNNMDRLAESKTDIVPKDGVIYPEQEVEFNEGESVFNILRREMKKNKIHMEFVNTPVYKSAYIEGIANIYEFDCGELSGWMYRVNGEFPNFGCSKYTVSSGDRIEWLYTCDLGADIGGGTGQKDE